MGRDGLPGAFEELVLLAVARENGDAYGMTVRREIQERSGREVTIGAVYATLDRLEAKGWLASSYADGDDDRSGRARRFFRLRPDGLAALEAARGVREPMWEGVSLERLKAETEGAP
ncbi:MAG: helix-turn-helix transcriptional regulator [Gemmatimonadota bacterium]|jgi:PadR family transcriptional regulator PadR